MPLIDACNARPRRPQFCPSNPRRPKACVPCTMSQPNCDGIPPSRFRLTGSNVRFEPSNCPCCFATFSGNPNGQHDLNVRVCGGRCIYSTDDVVCTVTINAGGAGELCTYDLRWFFVDFHHLFLGTGYTFVNPGCTHGPFNPCGAEANFIMLFSRSIQPPQSSPCRANRNFQNLAGNDCGPLTPPLGFASLVPL